MSYLLNHTTITIALGSVILSFLAGALGSFAVLRRQSLVGDAISHAALPGLVMAFILTGSKSPLVLMLGAAAAGLTGMLAVILITSTSRLKHDSALAIILSVFFGFGLVLLTWIQQHPQAAQAGLKTYLFGQAAALLRRDVIALGTIAVVALGVLIAFWKEFKILTFDRDYARTLGFPVRRIEILLTGLITVAIVLGLQTVGVVLMSAMIVAPAAAARQWTNRLGTMVLLAGILGATAGLTGTLASSLMVRMPTGPAIVLAIGVIVIISILFAPGRGLVAAYLRRRRNARHLRTDAVLCDLYELESQHPDEMPYGHTVQALKAMSFGEGDSIAHTLAELERRQLVVCMDGDLWGITQAGQRHVQNFIRHLSVLQAEEPA